MCRAFAYYHDIRLCDITVNILKAYLGRFLAESRIHVASSELLLHDQRHMGFYLLQIYHSELQFELLRSFS